MDLKEIDLLLATAKRPEKDVELCLRGDLQAEWERLEAQLAPETATLAASPEQQKIAAQVQAIEEEMRQATLTLRLRAMSRADWQELLAAHPPRKDNEVDRNLGLNDSTFWDALIWLSLVSPALDEVRLEQVLNRLTPRQFNTLTTAAWSLNQADVSVPFSLTASRIAGSSAAMSRPRSGSGSRTAGTPGGSQKKSPSTTTKLAG
jgi:hypothetical protein